MKAIYEVNGELIFHDPGPEMVRFFAEGDPSFKVMSIQPGARFTPKFQMLRNEMVYIDDPLIDMSSQELLEMLDKGLQDVRSVLGVERVSKFDILHALSLASLSNCGLCGWDCGVNRYQGPGGKCGLGSDALWNRPFIHIAEETVINPAIVTNFKRCALNCLYCIDHETLNAPQDSQLGPPVFWNVILKLQSQEVPITSLEFTNPTESLPGLIQILGHAPIQFNLPVVLNCHLYGSAQFWAMARYISDVCLPDLRYGNDKCAKRLSGVDNYMKYAKIGLDAMKGERMIVRILVLPGHVSCCHGPALELLSEYRDHIWVSVLDQYVPEHEAYLDPDLSRRPTQNEISEVKALVRKYGLRNIEERDDDFWRFDCSFRGTI